MQAGMPSRTVIGSRTSVLVDRWRITRPATRRGDVSSIGDESPSSGRDPPYRHPTRPDLTYTAAVVAFSRAISSRRRITSTG
jgi:hypothetical protein